MKKENFFIYSKQEIAQIIKEQFQNVLKDLNLQSLSEKKNEASEELIPRIDLANKLKISTVTLDKWVKNNTIPAPIKIGGRIYFDRQKVWDEIGQK